MKSKSILLPRKKLFEISKKNSKNFQNFSLLKCLEWIVDIVYYKEKYYFYESGTDAIYIKEINSSEPEFWAEVRLNFNFGRSFSIGLRGKAIVGNNFEQSTIMVIGIKKKKHKKTKAEKKKEKEKKKKEEEEKKKKAEKEAKMTEEQKKKEALFKFSAPKIPVPKKKIIIDEIHKVIRLKRPKKDDSGWIVDHHVIGKKMNMVASLTRYGMVAVHNFSLKTQKQKLLKSKKLKLSKKKREQATDLAICPNFKLCAVSTHLDESPKILDRVFLLEIRKSKFIQKAVLEMAEQKLMNLQCMLFSEYVRGHAILAALTCAYSKSHFMIFDYEQGEKDSFHEVRSLRNELEFVRGKKLVQAGGIMYCVDMHGGILRVKLQEEEEHEDEEGGEGEGGEGGAEGGGGDAGGGEEAAA